MEEDKNTQNKVKEIKPEQRQRPLIVIDAKGAILGRIASFAAKQALLGKKVIIVNCNDALITGRRKSIIQNYKEKRLRGGSSEASPKFPAIPEKIMKRTVRGMLSYKQSRGRIALDNIICYNEVPKEYESEKKFLAGRDIRVPTIKLKEIHTQFGRSM